MDRPGVVTIVGVGLIGGSVGLAIRSRGLAERVVGVGRDPARLEEARRLGAIDSGTTDLARGVAEAEVVVVGTPVDRVAADVREAASHAPPGVLITDAGSTKRRIVEAVEADDRARAAFVAAHPIAGSERNGVAHARADLFDGRACVLTPTGRTPADRLRRARAFWESVGCRVSELDPNEHDLALAWTSHLPHVVAAALAGSVPPEWLGLAAGAYRDGTRVAGAEPGLWAAIFAENRGPILQALDAFEAQLATFRRLLNGPEPEGLRRWWKAARARREQFRETPPEPPRPPIWPDPDS